MLKRALYLSLLTAGLWVAGFASSRGQALPTPAAVITNAATTNAPATNAPAATPPAKAFATGDVVAQAQAAMTWLQNLQNGLDPDQTLQEVNDDLPKLTAKIDGLTAQVPQSGVAPSLSSLQTAQFNWQTLSDSLANEQKNLSTRVGELDDLLAELKQRNATWTATLAAAQSAKAPPEITTRIAQVQAGIASAMKAVGDHLSPLYVAQTAVGGQAARAQTQLESVNKSLDTARQQLLEQNRPTLWNPKAFAHPAAGVVGMEKASLAEQASQSAAFLKTQSGAVLIHAFIFVLLVFGFYWMRKAIGTRAKTEPALEDAAHVFDVPIANALLLTLLSSSWLYVGQPKLLWAAFGAAALVPTVIVTRRLIDRASYPILYATVVAYFVDQLRHVVTPAGIISRFLFIFELMAASIFLLSALRLKHLSPTDPTGQTRLARLTRTYLHVAFFVLVCAGLINVLGYVQLSILMGEGMLESSYLAVILYAAIRIVDALAVSAISIQPLSRLGMVRRHRDLMHANVAVGIRWLFFATWFVSALQFFQQRALIWEQGKELLWKDSFSWFNITFTLGAILAFPITIWASFLISRFVRFVLEEEVYPHMALSRGIPYATSTMVHYSILLLGFFAAVAATGTQISQFAFLAGAFGVGLGFGLQNIMNNFVSGVILLFERPIKVGDVIQIDPATMGTVESIGIRASIILLANGAEVIVPNGNLISNPVTNWTLSNCSRQIEIPVTVASKVDSEHVISLLTSVALKHPDVLKNPAPRAYLVTFAGASLSFRLSVWIDSADEWMKVTSDLSLAINAELAKESIALG